MKVWLPAASVNAPGVDHLLWALLLVTMAVLLLVFGLMLLYMFRYRAGSDANRHSPGSKTWRVEVTWTAATLLAFFGLFLWGARQYVQLSQPPAHALKIYVVAKQWMWKAEHDGGQREINAVHVPVGLPIELVMTSEDVIHDFSVPAFRLKHDVLPGRYETLWFQAEVPGQYELYCTQLCGVDHARMTGKIVALSGVDYQRWLERNNVGETLAAAGKSLFIRYGCSGCHEGDSTVRAPDLHGLYGSPVTLNDGRIVSADEAYLHDSILQPERTRVAGFPPAMPSFAGQIGEEDLISLIAYLKSLAGEQTS